MCTTAGMQHALSQQGEGDATDACYQSIIATNLINKTESHQMCQVWQNWIFFDHFYFD